MPRERVSTRGHRAQAPRLELGATIRTLRTIREDPDAKPDLIEAADKLADELEGRGRDAV